MSHFYAAIKGGRGAATRCGHKTTGITAFAQSHEAGVQVEVSHDGNQDIFRIYLTGGRYGVDKITQIAEVYSSGSGDDIQVVHNIANGNLHNLTTAQSEFEFMEEFQPF